MEAFLVKRLFIADPALSNHQGHHFSVTDSFSKNAENRGFEVIWLVNKNFAISTDDQSERYEIELTFSEGTYDGYKKPKQQKQLGKTDAIGSMSRSEVAEPKLISLVKKFWRKLPISTRSRIRKIIDFVLKNKGFLFKILQSPKVIVKQNMPTECQPEVLEASEELFRVLKKRHCTGSDRVLFHTCDAHTYGDILSFFEKKISIEKWNLMPIFYLSTPYDNLIMPHNKTGKSSCHSIQHLDALGLIGTRIYLYAENELLSKYLANLWSLPVGTLYIPQQPIALDLQNSVEDGCLRICYLGSARTEKGFTFMVNAIEAYLSNEVRDDVHFTLQISPQIMGYTADIQKAVHRLKLIADSRLSLIENVQSKEEYQQSLLKADVLLLCYEKERYLVRSSGIVIEALANAKNVISTKGTFPHFIAGDAGIGVETIEEFINGVVRIADNKEHYKTLAILRKERFLDSISTEKNLDKLATDSSVEIKITDCCRKYNTSSNFEKKISYKNLI